MSAIQQMIMAAYGAAVWTPATLFAAGEQGVWYDPSDFSTMFQDSAGSTPVTAVGQPVGRILDKSGRGNHATQATAAARPVLQQDANGKYYLAFDGVDDSMATAAINFTATNKMSVFAGLRKLSDAAAIIVELGINAGGGSAFYLVSGEDGSARYSSLGTGTIGGGGVVAKWVPSNIAPDTAVLSATYNISADLNTIRRNGVDGTPGTTDQGTGNFKNDVLYIGSRAGTSLRFNGRIYSMIVRGALSDAAQIAAAEAYAAGKTGVML